MNITFVHVHVKPEFVEDFINATVLNAANSVKEPGNIRFDVFRQADEPAHFVLVEIYRTVEDAVNHKETRHYKTWRDTVGEMMAEPRKGIKYENIYPEETNW
jgi:(4S)-4-hydroxy-5-phosphonooxypentane-2,3-dione isomerase